MNTAQVEIPDDILLLLEQSPLTGRSRENQWIAFSHR